MAERSANHLSGRDPTSGIPMKLPSQFFRADMKALLSKLQIECKDCLSERLANAHYSFERERTFLNHYTIIREREREDKERTMELKRRFRRRLEDNSKRAAEQQQQALQAVNDSQTASGVGAELTCAPGAGVESSASRAGVLTAHPTAEATAETPMAPQQKITQSHIPPSFAPSSILQPTMAPRNVNVASGSGMNKDLSTRTTAANSTAVVAFDVVRDLFDDIELNAIDDKREALNVLQTAFNQSQQPYASPPHSNTNAESSGSRNQGGADLSMWKSNTNNSNSNSALDSTDSTISALKSRLTIVDDEQPRRSTESVSFKQSDDGIFVQPDYNADRIFTKNGDAFHTNVYITDESPLSLTLSG